MSNDAGPERTAMGVVGGLCVLAVTATASASEPVHPPTVRFFEQNVGQSDARVTHLSRGSVDTFYVTRRGIAFRAPHYAFEARIGSAGDVVATRPMRGVVHHLVGPRDRWQTNVPTLAAVERRAGEGVELIHRLDAGGRPTFDARVAAGVDIDTIEIVFVGPKELSIDEAGRLVLDGRVRLTRPVARQGSTRVRCDWVLRSARVAGFRVEDHDPRRPLLIDPTIEYASLYGGVASP